MDYMNVKQAAQRWGVTTRRVQDLCKQGRIPGAQRWERTWMLPANAVYPECRKGELNGYAQPLPRKSPFLDMTDLYSVPGSARECIAALEGQPEAQELFAAEISYSQGDIDTVYRHARSIMANHSSLYSVIAGGLLLGLCAMWKGDEQMWKKARIHICEAPCRSDVDRSILELSLAAMDIAIRDNREFPEWFSRGQFARLHPDAFPAAKVYYVKHLMEFAQDVAMNKLQLDGVYGRGLVRTMPYIIEPFISQAGAEKTVMAEIYLRLLCAIAYQNIGENQNAIVHIDKAIALALPDMLLGPLVEHRRQLGYLLDDRLALADAQALKQLKALHKQLHRGWTKLHNAVLDNILSSTLSVREREVAQLAAFGLTDGEIAQQLQLSKSTVKSLISMAKNKTGAVNRAELAMYI